MRSCVAVCACVRACLYVYSSFVSFWPVRKAGCELLLQKYSSSYAGEARRTLPLPPHVSAGPCAWSARFPNRPETGKWRIRVDCLLYWMVNSMPCKPSVTVFADVRFCWWVWQLEMSEKFAKIWNVASAAGDRWLTSSVVSDNCSEKRTPTETCVSDREGSAVFSTAHHSFICNFEQTYARSLFYLTNVEFLATDTEVPGSIPGATRFSE